jgi:hypothetical protein
MPQEVLDVGKTETAMTPLLECLTMPLVKVSYLYFMLFLAE